MEIRQNTLYVLTQGAYIRRDHLTVQVEVDGIVRLAVPIHNLEGVVIFGQVMVSPGMMTCCAEHGVAVTFLSESGRLMARVDSPLSGNVLLRREQFRWADRPDTALKLGRLFIAGKLANSRTTFMRAARESKNESSELRQVAEAQAAAIRRLEAAPDLHTIRGIEGAAAKVYFSGLSRLVRKEGGAFEMHGRSRRPPLDRMNALLSFLYALLHADCVGAPVAVGLDPFVGFLHADRPGKPSLALDLMEEFRPLLADRLALTLVNRRQVQANDFLIRDGGSVEISEPARRSVITAWRERKQEMVTHPLLDQSMTIGQLPHVQAKILAKVIRGDTTTYVPCTLK
jgi:CRISP-associated protein Cas1